MKQILIPLMVFYLCATPELHSQVRVDTHYHFPVYFPLFTQTKKPKIYLDGYHNNLHQKHTGFRPLSELLSDMGFEIEALNQPILKDDVLESCDILIIANAIHFGNRGRGYNPIYSAFTTDEIKVINRWVSGGGSLLLIADHMPFAGAAQDLAESFGVHLVNGFAGISEGVWPPSTFEAGLVGQGSSYQDYFKVDSVCTFTGSAIKWPDPEYNLLAFGSTDTAFLTDTAWVFGPATRKMPLQGLAQGGMMPYHAGKVGIFGEAAMFTAQLAGNTSVGFNSPQATDNVHFILNCLLSLLPAPESFDPALRIHVEKHQIAERYHYLDTLFYNNRMAEIAEIYAVDAYEVGAYFTLSGRESIAQYWLELKDRGIKWEHHIEELQVFGSFAFQTGTSQMDYRVGQSGEIVRSDVNYTIIWKKNEKGIWEIYRDHYTKAR